MDNTHIRAFIVDDEPAACNNLKRALANIKDISVDVTGIAHSTREAEKHIHQLQPAVVFLDIEMPNENAFQFLERIYPFTFEVIFVTAYDAYAVKAFKLNAIDYILKPIDIHDLKKALEKLAERLAFREYNTTLQVASKELREGIEQKKEQQQIILRNGPHWEIVAFHDILYIEAMRSYSKVVFFKENIEKNVIASYSVAEYEEMLPDNIFSRVHKSFLVNHQQIDRIWKEQDQGFVSLKNKVQIPVGRRRYPLILSLLKNVDHRNT